MVLEIAILHIKSGMDTQFERDFAVAGQYISSMKGYIDHSLKRCIEQHGKYILMVNWETLEDHTIGFRKSPEYQEWRKLLHHYYDPFPIVEHFVTVN